MNNNRLQEILISDFKKNFKEKFNRGVKVVICNKWQSEANFTDKVNFWAIVHLVFEFTGWKWDETYLASPYINYKGTKKVALRNEEKFFRRSLIDFIAVNNGASLSSCAKETDRKCHSTVINAISKFENRLEQEYYTQKLFNEIMEYVKDNYHSVKDKTTLKSGVQADNI